MSWFQASEYPAYLFRVLKSNKVNNKLFEAFLDDCFSFDQDVTPFKDIEEIKKENRRDQTFLTIQDFGAGSKVHNSKRRKVAEIARYSSKGVKYQIFLNKLIRHFNSKRVIELGTSLGFTTLYLAKGLKKGKIITLEGCPETAKIALRNTQHLPKEQVSLRVGEFDAIYPNALKELEKVDLVFFDGNHQFESTIRYFELALSHCHEQTVFVFDDIYWSKEMKDAWQKIKSHPKTITSIDLFQVGLVLFNPVYPRGTFSLKV